MTEAGAGFDGRQVVSFESRRANEMAALVARHGGVPVVAPAMREVALTQNDAAIDFARALRDGAFEVVILMTGVGTRGLLEEVAGAVDKPTFAAALARVPRLIVRGPKPAAVLREIGVARDRFVVVPEPNTWRKVAATVTARPLGGTRRVAVQEHGAPSIELYDALRAAGADVLPVPVYKWALPEDTAPLRRAVEAVAAGSLRVALFTSRAQVDHVFAIAADLGAADAVRRGFAAGLVASIGPVCTEALRAEGLSPDLEPTHPKMGHLVKEASEQCATILVAKGGG